MCPPNAARPGRSEMERRCRARRRDSASSSVRAAVWPRSPILPNLGTQAHGRRCSNRQRHRRLPMATGCSVGTRSRPARRGRRRAAPRAVVRATERARAGAGCRPRPTESPMDHPLQPTGLLIMRASSGDGDWLISCASVDGCLDGFLERGRVSREEGSAAKGGSRRDCALEYWPTVAVGAILGE